VLLTLSVFIILCIKMVMICKGFVSNSQMDQSILLLCGEILRKTFCAMFCWSSFLQKDGSSSSRIDAVLFVTHEFFPST
jgi:hypothetical protein